MEPTAKSVSIIGLDPGELRWLQMVLLLLRHSDPMVPELTRRALCYLTESTARPANEEIKPRDHAG